MTDAVAEGQAAVARDLLRRAERVVVLTGAGISTESGIPDYRGPNGVWTKDPDAEKLSDIRYFISDARIRAKAWQRRLEMASWDIEPNDGHRALVHLERSGRLSLLVTQNVDGLHQRAGSSPDRIVEVHGTVHESICLDCGDRGPMEPVLERVREGDTDPACDVCGGMLKSATISFGQALVEDDVRRSQDASEACDLFIAIGTSLQVYPVAYLPEIALRSGADLVIVNAEPTPFDGLAAAVLRGRIGDVLPPLVSAVS